MGDIVNDVNDSPTSSVWLDRGENRAEKIQLK